jgi:hypothetical protein
MVGKRESGRVIDMPGFYHDVIVDLLYNGFGAA